MNRLWYCLCLALCLSACSKAPDEQQIREAIEAMAEAVEQQSPGGLVEDVAEDFIGPRPEVDRDRLQNMARVMMLRNQTIYVLITNIDVQLVDEERATALVNAMLTGGSGLLPERGERIEVNSTWRKIDGRWQLVRADWDERFGYL
jgi:hypothetical protein